MIQMFVACLDDQYFTRGSDYSILKSDGYAWFRWISVSINIFTPLFLSILRLSEPAVLKVLKRVCCSCGRRKLKLPDRSSFVQLVERKSED